MQRTTFSGKSSAKGRNGYFKLNRATIQPIEYTGQDREVHINFFSKRRADAAPISLQLTPEDAATLAKFLMLLAISPDQIESIGEALDDLHYEYASYLSYGSPETDYGDEWPEVSKVKAEKIRTIASLADWLGIKGESERWQGLAAQYEGKEKCIRCGDIFDPGDDAYCSLCPSCADKKTEKEPA